MNREERKLTDLIEDLFNEAKGKDSEPLQAEAEGVVEVIRERVTLTPEQEQRFKADFITVANPLRGTRNLRVHWYVSGGAVVRWSIETGRGRRNKIQSYIHQ